MKNSGVTFLEKYAKFNVSKLTKITFILPLIVVLIAIAVIVGVGETTGNYTSAIGIGCKPPSTPWSRPSRAFRTPTAAASR